MHLTSRRNQRLRHRRLQHDFQAPTAPPSRTPLHVSLEKYGIDQFESEDDAPSNDVDSRVNSSVSDKKEQFVNDSNTDGSGKRFGIIAVSLAAVFAALAVVVMAMVWRRKRLEKPVTESVEEEQSPKFYEDSASCLNVESKPHEGCGVSILRNGDPMVSPLNSIISLTQLFSIV